MDHLPANHGCTIFRDPDGDYVIRSQKIKGLIAHGKTPDEAVSRLAEIMVLNEEMEKEGK